MKRRVFSHYRRTRVFVSGENRFATGSHIASERGQCATGFACASSRIEQPLVATHQIMAAHRAIWLGTKRARPTAPRALTLVEMMVAMAITLVMMAAVVTLFANVSNSVRNRRATIELSGQIRHVRNMLQQDLQGATCPGLTWQRPESNHGYIELIEGQYRERDASGLLNLNGGSPPISPSAIAPKINHETSIIPTSNLLDTSVAGRTNWVTDGGGLGDHDDILMLTVRNEYEPFVGRVPPVSTSGPTTVRPNATNAGPFAAWDHQTIESPLAEVVWFAIENPGFTGTADVDDVVTTYFGEPGMRTIYRRALLIAPWLNPYRYNAGGTTVDTFTDGGSAFKAEPGLLRILGDQIERTNIDQALASLTAFQDRYDISSRLEFDPRLGGDGRWKIVANTLGDLTKRENRFGHFGLALSGSNFSRAYPYAAVSVGSGYSGSSASVVFVSDPEIGDPSTVAQADAHVLGGAIVNYGVNQANFATPNDARYVVRPLAYVGADSTIAATARAMLNDQGQVVRVIHGLAPLWGSRRGEDVMLTDVLAFDLRVYDPGAPLFGHVQTQTILEPTDAGWSAAYLHPNNMADSNGSGRIGTGSDVFPFMGQGAYVDLGYGYDSRSPSPALPAPLFHANYATATTPWFFTPRGIHRVTDAALLTPGYALYDTWSFHYENNGINDDNDTLASGMPLIDEGTNGLDNVGHYAIPNPPPVIVNDTRLGVDDVGERETAPPYDKPLRGIQVLMRAYERDSRQIRQVRVNQHFMPE